MKTLIFALTFLFVWNAFAGPEECGIAIQDFNKAYGKNTTLAVDLLGGSLIVFQPKGYESSVREKSAASKVSRICIATGALSNNIYRAEPKTTVAHTLCQVQNINTMGVVCDKSKSPLKPKYL